MHFFFLYSRVALSSVKKLKNFFWWRIKLICWQKAILFLQPRKLQNVIFCWEEKHEKLENWIENKYRMSLSWRLGRKRRTGLKKKPGKHLPSQQVSDIQKKKKWKQQHRAQGHRNSAWWTYTDGAQAATCAGGSAGLTMGQPKLLLLQILWVLLSWAKNTSKRFSKNSCIYKSNPRHVSCSKVMAHGFWYQAESSLKGMGRTLQAAIEGKTEGKFAVDPPCLIIVFKAANDGRWMASVTLSSLVLWGQAMQWLPPAEGS